MDFNEYTTAWLVKERHAELVAAAEAGARRRGARAEPHPARVAVGTALIRVGAWLLRDHYEPRGAL